MLLCVWYLTERLPFPSSDAQPHSSEYSAGHCCLSLSWSISIVLQALFPVRFSSLPCFWGDGVFSHISSVEKNIFHPLFSPFPFPDTTERGLYWLLYYTISGLNSRPEVDSLLRKLSGFFFLSSPYETFQFFRINLPCMLYSTKCSAFPVSKIWLPCCCVNHIISLNL